MSVSVLVKNSCSTVGEGPHWEENSQTLLYVDIYQGDIHRYNTLTQKDDKINLASTVGFAVPRAKGEYVAGLGHDISVVEWDKATAKPIVTLNDDPRNRMNDGKCDAAGRIWAGTMASEGDDNGHRPPIGSLYCLDTDQCLTTKESPVTISNGLAWSADNRTMYYIDTTPKKIYAYDYDIDRGDISNKRVVADWSGLPPTDGYNPDGMCIDQEDKLWIACFFGSRVVRLDPETGKMLQKVEFPAARITSCCFGGKNYDELFVTSSHYELKPGEELKYPLAGSVFKVTGLGVKGSPGQAYQG